MPEPSPTILIVDDDNEIRNLVGNFLTQHHYQVHLAENGTTMFNLLKDKSFDCIILDIMLPGTDGLELCKQLRQTNHTIPIIMLTAVAEDSDKIIGLELGADDYLTKPFNPRELLARIKAIMRRSTEQKQQTDSYVEDPSQLKNYIFSNWELNQNTRSLVSPEQVDISLSTGEFDLLLALVRHPNRVLTRDQLLDITRNREAGPFDRSIDIQISRLRQKIENNPKKPKLIKTVRGGGYMFTPKVKISMA